MATPLPPSRSYISVIIVAVIFVFCSSSTSPAPLTTKTPFTSSPFAAALETLQKQIDYNFKSIALLRRAMTHSSYSIDNYRSLSILGFHALESSVSLRSFEADPDVSAQDLVNRVSAYTNSDVCANDGFRLGIERIVRVSPKTNASEASVVCGAFRAMFGAIAVDSSTVDSAGEVFLRVHKATHGDLSTFGENDGRWMYYHGIILS